MPGPASRDGGSTAIHPRRPEWAAIVKIDVTTSERRGGGIIHNLGSGTVIERWENTNGLIVTNAHVVRGRENDASVVVDFVQLGYQAKGVVVDVDETWDVAAVVTRLPENVQPVPLRETLVELGETLTAAGYPRGGDQISITRGHAAQYNTPSQRSSEAYMLTVAGAASQQGCSGGAILDAQGRLAAVLWGGEHGNTAGTVCARILQRLRNLRNLLAGKYAPGRSQGGGVRLDPIQGKPPEPAATPIENLPPRPSQSNPPSEGVAGSPTEPAAPVRDFGARLDKLAGGIERLLERPAKLDQAAEKQLGELKGGIDRLHEAQLGHGKLLGEMRDGISKLAPALEGIAPALAKLGAPIAAANPATAWLAPMLYAIGGGAGGLGGLALAWKGVKAVGVRLARRKARKAAGAQAAASQAPLVDVNLTIENLVKQAIAKHAPQPATPAATAPSSGGATAQPSPAFPVLEERAIEYGKQLVQASGLTGVDPVVAATRGIVLDDELANLAATGDQVASRLANDLKRRVDDRVAHIHPLAVNSGG